MFEGGIKNENEEPLPKKPKVRKVERKLVPVIEKLGTDDLVLESSAYQRFSRLLDHICESAEDVEITADLGEASWNSFAIFLDLSCIQSLKTFLWCIKSTNVDW